jgi:hypothetical protein
MRSAVMADIAMTVRVINHTAVLQVHVRPRRVSFSDTREDDLWTCICFAQNVSVSQTYCGQRLPILPFCEHSASALQLPKLDSNFNPSSTRSRPCPRC